MLWMCHPIDFIKVIFLPLLCPQVCSLPLRFHSFPVRILNKVCKVTLIDLRYMSSTLLEHYVDFENTDVLFLYSSTLLNRGSILK